MQCRQEIFQSNRAAAHSRRNLLVYNFTQLLQNLTQLLHLTFKLDHRFLR